MGGEFVFILTGSGGAVVEKPEKKTILRVRANVGVARVFLDGKEKGGVPIFFEGIRPGTYQVKVVADGYESYEKRVNISIGRESEVTAWLE
ncbi:MAG: PEGA domain-containing protein, partial [Herbaspirillum sp.]|nr:PEGA domain-containing protein [Herbaspirillum sp.]